MALHHNPRIVTDGLVLALDAADTNSYPGSGTTWYDLSGNNYHTTLSGSAGPVFSSEGHFHFPNRPDVNGPNSSLARAITPTLPAFGAITVEVSYKPYYSGSLNYFGTVFRQSLDDVHIRDGRVAAGERFDDFQLAPTAAEQHNGEDEWVINTLVWDGSTELSLYKDGQLTKTGNRSTPDTNGIASSHINIGTRNDNYGEHYTGYISTFKIYNRALTAQEVLQNYNATKTRFGL